MRYKKRLPIKHTLFGVMLLLTLVVTVVIITFEEIHKTILIENVTILLKRRIATNFESQLNNYFDHNETVICINAQMIALGQLDHTDIDALFLHFYEQSKINRDFNNTYFGNPQGGIIVVEKHIAVDSLAVVYTENFEQGTLYRWRVDEQMNKTHLLATVEDFDVRRRPWYQAAIAQASTATPVTMSTSIDDMIAWTDAYTMRDIPELCVTLSKAIYTPDGQFLGVIAIDMLMSFLNKQLKYTADIEKRMDFIIGHDGNLIATSEDLPLSLKSNETGRYQRIGLADSENDVISAFIDEVTLEKILSEHHISNAVYPFFYKGQKHFLLVVPFTLNDDIDWIILSVMTETDFLKNVDSTSPTTYFLIVVLIVVSMCLAYFMAGILTKPIQKLRESTRFISEGNFSAVADTDSPFTDINDLAADFNIMSKKIEFMVAELNHEIQLRYMTEKELETTLNNQRLESIGNLAAGIAHQFNNALQSVFGYIELALTKVKDEKAKVYLAKATESMEESRKITRHLLTFAKAGNLQKKTEKMEPFLRGIIHYAFAETDVKYDLKIAPDILSCNIDKSQITQAIDCIILNAIQESDPSGCIEITAENLDTTLTGILPEADIPYVCIKIKDYGKGISTDEGYYIYDPFYSTKPQAQGLGLTTARSIITKHKGLLTFESEVGKWTEFSIILPANET